MTTNTYTLQDVQANGACKSLGELFQWGFSYIQPFTAVLALAVWTSGTCLLTWCRIHRFPSLQGQPEQPRGIRALLLLAEAINGELESSGIDPHTITNKALNECIYKTLKGGSASFGFPCRNKKMRNHHVLRWVKGNLGWLVIVMVFGAGIPFLSQQLILVLTAISSAYFIGTTWKSKLILAALLAAVFFPVMFLGHIAF
ncbi:hypothetical protein F5B17DRAFT_108525 [Nemania serpens]|nr:hypothetical protein F5B17DRAFT_108525 [Nemania serpens]